MSCIFCSQTEAGSDYHNSSAAGTFSSSASASTHNYLNTPAPSPSPADSMPSNDHGPSYSMDILASVFFVVAAGWLFIALLYALLAMTFLRIRARGNLDRIYDEDFGRVYICGNFYLPFGCLLRRYIQHMLRGDQPRGSGFQAARFMTREERRRAMEVLLKIPPSTTPSSLFSSSPSRTDSSPAKKRKDRASSLDMDIDCEAPTSPHNLSSSLDEEAVCCICLGAYHDDQDPTAVLQSVTCPHRFHNECILDWLQRQANLECPCCRLPMVSEEDVWKTVKRHRKERKKQHRQARKKNKEADSQLPAETESTDSGEIAVSLSSSQSVQSSSQSSSSSSSSVSADTENPVPEPLSDTENQITSL